jgi:hypothetical protein
MTAKRKNAGLEAELDNLKQAQSQGLQVLFGVNAFGRNTFGGSGVSANSVPPARVPTGFIDDVRDLGVWVLKLELMDDGDAITVGIITFRSVSNCEAFIWQECPGGIQNT